MSLPTFHEHTRALATAFAADAAERATRQTLDPDDFASLVHTGYLRCAIPESHGGWFRSVPASTRLICDTLRTLASGDGCVALVAAMHPAVLIYWGLSDSPPAGRADAWKRQRQRIFDGVLAGELWGTITSEPGSGGDVLKTRATARPQDDGYRLSGDKHFGTGSGMNTWMVTTAIPEGESLPDVFFVGIKDRLWDGSEGVVQTAEWSAHGVMATQSHAFRFDDFPAERIAWSGRGPEIGPLAGAYANALFVSVIVGILDTAMSTARRRMASRLSSMRALEQVAWQRAENDYWTVCQAYEGMLRAIETRPAFIADTIRAKTAIAELAERAVTGVGRAMGGGAFTRYNPLGQWSQDIKALGFLRPPWGLAFEQLHQLQIASLTET